MNHAKDEEIGLGNAIGKVTGEDKRGSLHYAAAAGGSLNVCKYLIETLKLDVGSEDEYGIEN